MTSQIKEAKKQARKLAAGGLGKKQKAKTVSKWADAMKAVIKGGK